MQRTCACLCSSFPLSLKGPKGEGDQGGEGSRVGLGGIPPKNKTFALDTPERPYYHSCSSNRNSVTQGGIQKPGETPRDPTRGLNPRPTPTALAQARGTSQGRNPRTTGPVPLPCPSRRWKVHNINRHAPHIGALPKNSGLMALEKSPPSFPSEIPVNPATAARKHPPTPPSGSGKLKNWW